MRWFWRRWYEHAIKGRAHCAPLVGGSRRHIEETSRDAVPAMPLSSHYPRSLLNESHSTARLSEIHHWYHRSLRLRQICGWFIDRGVLSKHAPWHAWFPKHQASGRHPRVYFCWLHMEGGTLGFALRTPRVLLPTTLYLLTVSLSMHNAWFSAGLQLNSSLQRWARPDPSWCGSCKARGETTSDSG